MLSEFQREGSKLTNNESVNADRKICESITSIENDYGNHNNGLKSLALEEFYNKQYERSRVSSALKNKYNKHSIKEYF